MPLTSAQLAALVDRARTKPPPAAQRPVRPAKPVKASSPARPTSKAETPPRCHSTDRIATASAARAAVGEHRRGRGFPHRLGSQEGLLALPPPVLRRVPPADGARRILPAASPDPAWSGRASRRELLAGHTARSPPHADDLRYRMAAHHHPAEELAAGAGWRPVAARAADRSSPAFLVSDDTPGRLSRQRRSFSSCDRRVIRAL